MSDSKAARRYSEALFRLAAEQGCLDAVAADLRAIQRLSQESPALADLKAASIQIDPRYGSIDLTTGFLAMPNPERACAGLPVMSAPLKTMRPEVGCNRQEAMLNKVVLPAPLGPITL